MKKLKQKTGETLTETLVALVIMALALIMLPGAVVAAARVNATTEKQVIFMEKTLEAEKGVKAGSCDITFSMDSISQLNICVQSPLYCWGLFAKHDFHFPTSFQWKNIS